MEMLDENIYNILIYVLLSLPLIWMFIDET